MKKKEILKELRQLRDYLKGEAPAPEHPAKILDSALTALGYENIKIVNKRLEKL